MARFIHLTIIFLAWGGFVDKLRLLWRRPSTPAVGVFCALLFVFASAMTISLPPLYRELPLLIPGAQFNVYDCLNGASNGQNLARRRLSDGTDALISPKGPGNLAVDAYASSWVGNGSPVGLWEYWGDPGNKLQHWY
jgi:hypothetical protein